MRDQRRVVLVTASAVGLALLVLMIGLGYDQLWVPSRPVAKVGAVTLSRRDYWQERRSAYAHQIVQNFQLLALFGGSSGNEQFTQQFSNQSPTLNAQVKTIRTSAVDDGVVNQWETLQIQQQGAAQLGVSVSLDEINQAIANDLSLIFIPAPAAPITATATISGTATAPVADATAALSATPTLMPTSAPSTPTPGGPSPTPAPTETLEPTETPMPTPAPAEAVTQVGQIVDEIFRRYELELAAASQEAALTKEDFRAALVSQYQEQLLNTRVEEKLVPDAGFVESSEPAKVKARQILIAVTPPADASQDQIDALFSNAKIKADQLRVDLHGGAEFVGMAMAASDDPGSAAAGGDLGYFDKTGHADNGATYPPELVATAFALAPNTVSDPIRTQFGWHIIEVIDRDIPARDTQLRDARTKALDTWIAEQRAAISSERFPAQTPTPTGGTETPTVVPTYLPGPPTEMPTPTQAQVPTEAATAVSAAPQTPTAAGTVISATQVPTAASITSPTATSTP
ncbi:MAG: peptidylprolyl isomerase [Oscillochloris sp.]|nr:peptidylprolyl isomerase [Oscillochloris sp.]